MINRREKIKAYEPFIGWKNFMNVRGKTGHSWIYVSCLCLIGALAITAFATGAANTGNGDRGLAVSGPGRITAGQPLAGIKVRFFNRSLDAPDSRLRLIIHAEGGGELKAGDIKIEVKEGKAWQTVQVEAIDDGVMGAIGESGKPHTERHQNGGFAIAKIVNRLWPLRLTFLLPGRYTLVVAVSPDNGQTHLVQPASLNMEAL